VPAVIKTEIIHENSFDSTLHRHICFFPYIVDDDSQFVFFSSWDVIEYEIRTYQEGYKVSIAMNLREV
jgi:hypothetical protein